MLSYYKPKLLGIYFPKGFSVRWGLLDPLEDFSCPSRRQGAITRHRKVKKKKVFILYIQSGVIKIRNRGITDSNNNGEKQMIEKAEVIDITDASILYRLSPLIVTTMH